MGIGGSTQDNLQQLDETQKLCATLREILPGTREYAKLLLSGLAKCYPRGFAFVVEKEGLTEERIIDVQINQNYLFMIWLKMIMWCDEHLTSAGEGARGTT